MAVAAASKGKLPPPPEVIKGAKPEAPTVTIVHSAERTRIPLMARVLKKGEAPKPAIKLNQDPWAIETLTNGVRIKYTVTTNRKNQLELIREVLGD